jgi:predicted nuclease with TOPRIM domain
VSDTRAEEVLQLQQELADTKMQAAGLQKENRALLKALQESKQRQNDVESTISALSSQPHPEQVPELLLEVSKLNAALQQQEGGLSACALRCLSV